MVKFAGVFSRCTYIACSWRESNRNWKHTMNDRDWVSEIHRYIRTHIHKHPQTKHYSFGWYIKLASLCFALLCIVTTAAATTTTKRPFRLPWCASAHNHTVFISVQTPLLFSVVVAVAIAIAITVWWWWWCCCCKFVFLSFFFHPSLSPSFALSHPYSSILWLFFHSTHSLSRSLSHLDTI